jgi:hypothetical protein
MARAEPRSAQFAVLGGAQRRIGRVVVEHFGFGDLRVRQAGFNDLRVLETGELGGMRIARLSLRTSGRGQCAGRQRLLERTDLGRTCMPDQDAAVVGALVAVVEQADVPGRAASGSGT